MEFLVGWLCGTLLCVGVLDLGALSSGTVGDIGPDYVIMGSVSVDCVYVCMHICVCV